MKTIKSEIEVRDFLSSKLINMDIDVCLVYGRFGTNNFRVGDQINLVVIGNITSNDCYLTSMDLEEELGILLSIKKVEDLEIHSLYKVAFRNDILFCKDENRLNDFIEYVDDLYKSIIK